MIHHLIFLWLKYFFLNNFLFPCIFQESIKNDYIPKSEHDSLRNAFKVKHFWCCEYWVGNLGHKFTHINLKFELEYLLLFSTILIWSMVYEIDLKLCNLISWWSCSQKDVKYIKLAMMRRSLKKFGIEKKIFQL